VRIVFKVISHIDNFALFFLDLFLVHLLLYSEARVNKQTPIGSKNWVVTVAQKYGLLSTLKTKGKHKHEKKI
jgi:hypothetical protein